MRNYLLHVVIFRGNHPAPSSPPATANSWMTIDLNRSDCNVDRWIRAVQKPRATQGSFEMQKLFVPAMAAFAVAGTLVVAVAASTEPAEAGRKSCEFRAFDRFSRVSIPGIKGNAKALKRSWACNRAKRRCQRKLRKAWKNPPGRVDSLEWRRVMRAGCVRFVNRFPVL